jgi:hypothetical protein
MAKLSYGKPTMKIHGSVEELTQVFGTTEQDFINGVSDNDTGSFDLICEILEPFPQNCNGVPH